MARPRKKEDRQADERAEKRVTGASGGGSKRLGKPGFKAGGKPGFKFGGKPGAKASGKPGAKASGKPGAKASGKPGFKAGGKPGFKFGGKPGVRLKGGTATGARRIVKIRPSGGALGEQAGTPVGQPQVTAQGRSAARAWVRPDRKLLHGKPGAKPAGRPGAKPLGKPVARPAGRPGAKPLGKPVARPAGRPGAKPLGKPGAKPASLPSRPAGSPAPLRPAAPPDPLTLAKAAWQPCLRWCKKETRDTHLMDPKVRAAVEQFQSAVQTLMAASDAAQFLAAQEGVTDAVRLHPFLRWAPLPSPLPTVQ